jgi:hypothetical protein
VGSLTDRLRALSGFLPVGLERLFRTALGDWLNADLVPGVIWGLLLLALVPAVAAGASTIVNDVTPTQMFDRSVPTDVTLVAMPGLVMPLAPDLSSEPGIPTYLYLVRETTPERRLVVVRTTDPPARFMARSVTARIADEGGTRLLLEVEPAGETPREVSTVSDALAEPLGTLVRIDLRFSGEETPVCATADAGCGRSLAAGTAIFAQEATGPTDGAPVIVRTTYPASAAPGSFAGPQIRDPDFIAEFLARPEVRALAGWGRVLSTTYVQVDPSLPVHRSWLGPILFALAAVLLWIGRRIGYPLFEPAMEGSRRWIKLDVGGESRRAPVETSGHMAPAGGGRIYLDEDRGTFIPPGPTEAVAVIELDRHGTRLPLVVPAHTGTLGSVERGYVIRLHGRRPALWIHWFGTDLRLVFESEADRDMAAAAIGS